MKLIHTDREIEKRPMAAHFREEDEHHGKAEHLTTAWPHSISPAAPPFLLNVLWTDGLVDPQSLTVETAPLWKMFSGRNEKV